MASPSDQGSDQGSGTNDPPGKGKRDRVKSKAAGASKGVIGSSCDNVPSQDQQALVVFHPPYTSGSLSENQPIGCFGENHLVPSAHVNQWHHQFPLEQPNPVGLQGHTPPHFSPFTTPAWFPPNPVGLQGQTPPHFSPLTTPDWFPLNPVGLHGYTPPYFSPLTTPDWFPPNPVGLHGHTPPYFSPLTTPDWFPPNSNHSYPGVPVPQPGTVEATNSPNYGYPVSAYPGVSDSWNPPSSSWAHTRLLHPPNASNYTLMRGYPSSQIPTFPNSTERSSQREVIKLHASSWKQQFEAQSAENSRLQSVIDQLQSEISRNKSQIAKLEEELSYFTQQVGKGSLHVGNTTVSGQEPKRGRPRIPAESNDAPVMHDESRPRGRPRLSMVKAKARPRAAVAEKVILNLNEGESQVGANMSGTHTCEAGFRSSIPKNDDKSENLQNAGELLSDVPIAVAKKEMLGSSDGEMDKGIGEQSTAVHEDESESEETRD